MPASLENSAVATGLEKGQFSFQSQRKAMPKNVQTTARLQYLKIASISHTSKIMLKILQARLQWYVNWEFPVVEARFRKGQRSYCQYLLHYQKSKRIPEKHLLLLHWLRESLWLCGSQQTGKFLKRWEYQITLPASWEICMQVKKQYLEPGRE